MTWKSVSTTILFLMLIAMPILGLQIVSATGDGKSLPAGSWWTLKGTYREVSTGSGSWEGTYTETDEYTMKILVTNKNSDTITLSNQKDEKWSCTATGTWSCSPGTKSHTYQYTIALNTLKVISVGGEADKDFVGHPTYLIVNGGQLTEGGKAALYWWVPNSNGKGDMIADVDFSVDTQTANIKGTQLKAWRLSYNGDTLGWYHNDNGVYSKGPATKTDLYDPVYGIMVGYSWKSNTNGVAGDASGTWTEDYSDDGQLEDTNLSFTAPVTTSVQTTTAATTVYAASYQDTWVIFSQRDPQERPFATVLAKYASQDTAVGTLTLGVDVSLTYVNDATAHLDWIEFYDIAVHLRNTANGTDVAVSSTDSSHSRVNAGGQYTHSFSVSASQPGQYFVALTWKTSAPDGAAYGLTIDAAELSYDTGNDPNLIPKVNLTTQTTTTAISTSTATTGTTGSSALAVETTTPTAVEKPASESYWFYIGAGLIAIVIVLLVALIARRRGRAVASQPSQTPSPAITGPSTTAAGEKFCINCGSRIPATTAFCPTCGERQP